METNKKTKLQDLEEMYKDAQASDKTLYSEMRSYVLLKSGEHYSKKWIQSQLRNRRNDVPEEVRIRLTKNEIQKIIKLYVGNLISAAPGAMAVPNNEKEPQDQKAAELHNAVLSDIKRKHNMAVKIINYADDFVTIGESIVQIGWNWEKGVYKRTVPKMDEMGMQVGEETHFSGALEFNRIFGPDFFRPADAKNLDDAPWWGVQKMIPIKTLKRKYKDDPEKLKMLTPSINNTFVAFEQSTATYSTKKNHILVKEIYYKPCIEYKNGYFFYFVEGGILEEGELPMGIWPFVMQTIEEVQTSPRGLSPIKHWKPLQVELNRMASKIAEHQITLGDDKVVIAQGAKLSSAGTAPGIRAYSSAGQGATTVIPGRSGDQYLPHVQATRAELYDLALVTEELQDKMPGQVDPYTLLLQSAKWKKKFATNITKFEKFVLELYEKALEFTRAYIEEDELIQVVGKNEVINIPEFKNANRLCYSIKLEPQSEDIETRLGKKLAIDRYLQYAGSSLTKEDVGKFIRLDPYLNKEELMSDLTLDYDNAVNVILSLDRGQQPIISPSDNVDYLLKKLVNRQRQPDYNQLPDPIKMSYEQTVQGLEAMKAQQLQQQQQAEQGLIPAQGMLVTCDMYQPDPKDPTRQVRVRVPYTSLQWLLERLNQQGQSQELLQMQQQQTVSDIMQQMGMQNQQPQQGMIPGGQMNPMAGQPMG